MSKHSCVPKTLNQLPIIIRKIQVLSLEKTDAVNNL